jgi:hypothetical protein
VAYTLTGTVGNYHQVALDIRRIGWWLLLVDTDYIIAEKRRSRQQDSWCPSIPLRYFLITTQDGPQIRGTVTSVATSLPLTGGTITGAGTIGINQASGSQDGYLSAEDWTTFNG